MQHTSHLQHRPQFKRGKRSRATQVQNLPMMEEKNMAVMTMSSPLLASQLWPVQKVNTLGRCPFCSPLSTLTPAPRKVSLSSSDEMFVTLESSASGERDPRSTGASRAPDDKWSVVGVSSRPCWPLESLVDDSGWGLRERERTLWAPTPTAEAVERPLRPSTVVIKLLVPALSKAEVVVPFAVTMFEAARVGPSTLDPRA